MDSENSGDSGNNSTDGSFNYTDYQSPYNLHIARRLAVDCVLLKWEMHDELGHDQKFQVHCWSADKDKIIYDIDCLEQPISELKLATRYFAYIVVMAGDMKVSAPSNLLEFCADSFVLELMQDSNVSNSMVKLRWSLKWNNADVLLHGRKKYCIHYWSDESDEKFINTHCNNYNIKGLKSDASYTAYIMVVDGESILPQMSNTIEFQTEPRRPKNIRVSRFEASPHDHLLITFDGKQGDDVEHEIVLTPLLQDVEDKTLKTRNLKVIATDLKPGRMYNVYIRTMEGLLNSQFSTLESIALLCPDIPKLNEPVMKNGTITMSWVDLDVKPLKYVIYWTENGSRHNCYMEETSFGIGNLQFCTTYKFQVAAINDAGRSPLSEVQTQVTGPPPLKNAMLVENPSSPQTSFIVRFHDPNPAKKTYMAVAKQPNDEHEIISKSECNVIVMNDLIPGGYYQVSVISIFNDVKSTPVYCSVMSKGIFDGPVLS